MLHGGDIGKDPLPSHGLIHPAPVLPILLRAPTLQALQQVAGEEVRKEQRLPMPLLVQLRAEADRQRPAVGLLAPGGLLPTLLVPLPLRVF